MKALLTLLLAAASVTLLANDNPWIQQGDDDFYNLDYDQAIAAYEKAVAGNPEEPVYHNHLAQGLLYREMYRNGALESELVSGNNSFLRRPKTRTAGRCRKTFLLRDRSLHAAFAGAHCKECARYRCAARVERCVCAAGELRLPGAQELAGVARRMRIRRASTTPW